MLLDSCFFFFPDLAPPPPLPASSVPPAGPAEAVVSENSIHMVPFQFDLIQLLPKCQQVELFFLTFSTGTTLTSPPVTVESLA